MVNKRGNIGRTQTELEFHLIEVRSHLKAGGQSDISDCACERFIWRQCVGLNGRNTDRPEKKDS